MRETLKVLIGLYNEKRLDPKASEIIGLDFALQKVLSGILKLEQRQKCPIISKKKKKPTNCERFIFFLEDTFLPQYSELEAK